MKIRRSLAVTAVFCILLGSLSGCSKPAPQAADTQPAITEIQAAAPQETEQAVVLHPVEETKAESSDRHSEAPGDASGFVLVTDVIPDAILEIRYFSTYNFIGDRIEGYEEPCALLTREAALALKNVSEELMAMGYRIKIFDAYRPQMAVDHFVRWAEDLEDTRMKAYFYPEVPKAELFSQGYIASRSGHSRGSTVDVTLVDMATGREVDMGGSFDFFGEQSHGDYAGLTPEQKANRQLLKDVMTAHGFRAIATEWWHFTLEAEPYPDLYFIFPVSEDSVLRESQ